MSLGFDNHNDRLEIASDPGTTYTAMWWSYVTSAGYRTPFAVTGSSGLMFQREGSGYLEVYRNFSVVAQIASVWSQNTWYRQAMSINHGGGAASLNVYHGEGLSGALSTTSGNAGAALGGTPVVDIGTTTYVNENLIGYVAGLHIVQGVELTGAECEPYWKALQWAPGRTWASLPLYAAGHYQDYSGNGRHATSPGAGTPATEDNPPGVGPGYIQRGGLHIPAAVVPTAGPSALFLGGGML